MKSAREGNLRNWGEFAHELLAQYLLTGKITFNPLPETLQVGTGASGRKQFRRSEQLMRDNTNVDGYISQLEASLQRVLNSAVGKIFVM